MKRLFRLLLGIAFALAGCGTPPPVRPHVVQISVDGLRADRLHELMDANQLPNVRRLVMEGASTFNARTDFDNTVTLPNHTSMLTGRPVRQPNGQPADVPHGYTRNSTPRPDETVHNAGNPNVSYVSSVFDVVHDHGLSTALFASKNKFILYQQSYGNKIDRVDLDEQLRADSTLAMQHDFIAALNSKKFDYVFLHYRDPDTAGHAHGWESEEWNESVRRVDGYLGDLLALLQRNRQLRAHTTIILSADHGGTGTNHNTVDDHRVYTLPFVVWGPGVAAGSDLYALNPDTRADPGWDRPDYNASPQPIRNGDGGNLALMLLGLGPIPGSTINARQDLRVSKEKP